jgi:KDO2-lipid IV(A) lauroyltransferase
MYIYIILKALIFIFEVIPRRLGLILGNIIGIIVYHLSQKARKVSFHNVSLVLHNMEDNGSRREFVIKNFRRVGMNLVDALRLEKYKHCALDKIVRVKNGNNINSLLQRGKGLIVITAHLGCWEIIPAYFAQKGYPVNVIAREVYDKNVNREISRIREAFDVRVIDKNRSSIVALKRLLSGEAVGVLIDQNTNTNSITIDFMGRRARTPIGPAYLAMKTGAPVIPVAIHRLKNGKHMIEVGEEVEIIKTANEKSDIVENTRRCSKAVEKFIREYHEEWVWFHNRWG